MTTGKNTTKEDRNVANKKIKFKIIYREKKQ